MLIILPNLKHSFISPVPDSGFRIPVPVPDPDFRVFHTPLVTPTSGGFRLKFLIFVQMSHVHVEPKRDKFSSQNEITNNKNDQSNKINNKIIGRFLIFKNGVIVVRRRHS